MAVMADSGGTAERRVRRYTREGDCSWMLFAALGQRKRPVSEMGGAFAELWRTPAHSRGTHGPARRAP